MVPKNVEIPHESMIFFQVCELADDRLEVVDLSGLSPAARLELGCSVARWAAGSVAQSYGEWPEK